ncbi:MAG: transcriptional regulator EpsA [Rugosibacter sp.]|nr:transcriptional regulator EpsA [Rugosibacter sp.]
MSDYVVLNTQDKEHFVFTIETSLKINKRFQFFLWAQGALQGFIPHETLLCAYGDIAQMRFRHEIFAQGVFDSEVEREITSPVNGLLPRLLDLWLHDGGKPCLLSPDTGTIDMQSGRQRLRSDLQRCGLDHVAAHGSLHKQDSYGSFFVFIGADPHTARDAYLLELLMPYLHIALQRMLSNESGDATASVSPETLLSGREIQVLQWVKNGKTNQEIGQILNISPLTVKNHVQKILRKLNVSNRAQAVGKGAASRLFSPDDAG